PRPLSRQSRAAGKIARSTSADGGGAERFPPGPRLAGVFAGLIPLDAVKVEAAVGEVAHGALGPRPGQVGQVDVADRQGFDVLARFGRDPVACEGEITRRQDATLRVLDVHVGDARQVAHIAREHDEALVLDRPRLPAIAYAQVALAAVGAEGDEDDPRAFVRQAPRELGEFAVVTDEHADGADVRGDHIDAVAAADVPPVTL